jgi:hypothetical protein
MNKEFREHRPGYFTGFENQTYDVKDFNEVLEIPFVKKFSEGKGFYSYAVSVDTEPEYRLTLMALYNWDDEYNGCKTWLVVGYLPGFIMYETKLKKYEDLIHGHKPNCWTRKYIGNKDMLGWDRPEESKMKILKELGWERPDLLGYANYCNCGLKK